MAPLVGRPLRGHLPMRRARSTPRRRSRGSRIVFARRGRLARSLALLGLGSLLVAYPVPIAAAATQGDLESGPPPLVIPGFAYPQFEQERDADRGREAAGGGAGEAAPADAGEPAASGGTGGGAPAAGDDTPPAAPSGSDQAPAGAEPVVEVVENSYALAPLPSADEEQDPFAGLQLIHSGTGPVPIMGIDPLSAGQAQPLDDPLAPSLLPPLPADDSAVVVDESPADDDAKVNATGSSAKAGAAGSTKAASAKARTAASSAKAGATASSSGRPTAVEIDAVLDDVIAAARTAEAAQPATTVVRVAAEVPESAPAAQPAPAVNDVPEAAAPAPAVEAPATEIEAAEAPAADIQSAAPAPEIQSGTPAPEIEAAVEPAPVAEPVEAAPPEAPAEAAGPTLEAQPMVAPAAGEPAAMVSPQAGGLISASSATVVASGPVVTAVVATSVAPAVVYVPPPPPVTPELLEAAATTLSDAAFAGDLGLDPAPLAVPVGSSASDSAGLGISAADLAAAGLTAVDQPGIAVVSPADDAPAPGLGTPLTAAATASASGGLAVTGTTALAPADSAGTSALLAPDPDSTTSEPSELTAGRGPPAPGSVLILAAEGGTVVSGDASLTFLPGSLPADAYVQIRPSTVIATEHAYDLSAWDAATGESIETFRSPPQLTITTDGVPSHIVYVAPDGTTQDIASSFDGAAVTAGLPHFSTYMAAPLPWRIQLIDANDHSLVISVVGTDIVVVVDGGAPETRPIDAVTLIRFLTGSGNDTVTLLGPVPVPVFFEAGTGNDRILGPAADATWNLNGVGSGSMSVDGPVANPAVSFTGVEDIVGAAGNRDLFLIAAGADFGLVDGGAGGTDGIELAGLTGLPVVEPSGTGTLTLGVPPNQRTIDYADIEPGLVITFSGTDRQVFLEQIDDDTYRVRQDVGQDVTFTVVSGGALTIYAGGADVQLGAVNLTGTLLIVKQADNLSFVGNLTTNGLVVRALRTIGVAAGVTLDARPGDLTLAVNAAVDLDWLAITPFFKDRSAAGSLTVGAGATLRGADVSLTVNTTTANFADFEVDEFAVGQYFGSLAPALEEGLLPDFIDNATQANPDAPDTIERDQGSWFDDGFQVGQTIQIAGSLHNDGFFHIAAITDLVMTLAAGEALTTEYATSEVQIDGVVLMTGTPDLTFATATVPGDTVDQITRSTGDWVADGFKVGQTISLCTRQTDGTCGTGVNDGDYTVLAVSATVLTVDAANAFTAGTFAGRRVTAQGSPGEIPLSVVDHRVRLTATDVGFFFTGATLMRGEGSWIADGFAPHMTVVVSGRSVNAGSYTVLSVTADTLTFANGVTFLDERVKTGVDVQGVAGVTPPPTIDTLPALTFAGQTISRDDGRAWALDGFAAGQRITILGTRGDGVTSNDGSYVIASLAGTVITIVGGPFIAETTTPDAPEATDADPEATNDPATSVDITAHVSPTIPELHFSGQTITRSSGSWLADEFVVGDRILVDDTVANNSQYEIAAISDAAITIAGPPTATLNEEYVRGATVNRMVPASQVNGGQPLTVAVLGDALKLRLAGISDLVKYIAQVMFLDATATITIADTAFIDATGSLTIDATTVANMALKTESLWIGVTFGDSDARATVTVGNATLHAVGALAVTAHVTHTMAVGTKIVMGLNPKAMFVQRQINCRISTCRAGLIPGPALVAAVGYGKSTTSVTVGDAAIVQGGY